MLQVIHITHMYVMYVTMYVDFYGG